MYNTLHVVAENWCFPKEFFRKFAVSRAEQYHIDIQDSSTLSGMSVNTWYVDSLINDFKNICMVFTFKLQSPKTPCFNLKTYGTSYEEAREVAEKTCERMNKYGIGWKLL